MPREPLRTISAAMPRASVPLDLGPELFVDQLGRGFRRRLGRRQLDRFAEGDADPARARQRPGEQLLGAGDRAGHDGGAGLEREPGGALVWLAEDRRVADPRALGEQCQQAAVEQDLPRRLDRVLVGGAAAAVVCAVAWSTYRAIHHRHERLEPHHAVNRLVLAKACALAGAMVAGAYFGYALSWVGNTDGKQLAKLRLTQSVLAGLAGVVVVAGALLLEQHVMTSGDEDITR